MSQRKIIITFDDEEVDHLEAAASILRILSHGQVSESRGISHFCWFTELQDGTRVSTMRKRTAESADSFWVRKPKAGT